MRRAVDARDSDMITSAATSGQDIHRDRRWLVMAAVGAISFVLIVARRPDALFNPQFYAEDGKYFYAQAYNLGGLHALTIPLRRISHYERPTRGIDRSTVSPVMGTCDHQCSRHSGSKLTCGVPILR